MTFDTYAPKPEDIVWALRIVAGTPDGNALPFPTTRLVYRINHRTRTITLQNPAVLFDETDGFYNAHAHHRITETFKVIHFRVIGEDR